MFSRRKTILFFGAHPDDIALGAGASIAKLAKEHDIFCYTMSKNTKREGQNNLPKEDKDALKILGVKSENINILDFETRNFTRDRQVICDKLWELRKKHNPDIVFTHSENDIHQDHVVMAAEARRVFRDITVLGMEVARSQVGFAPQLFVEVGKSDIKKKVDAIACYKSFKDLNYMQKEQVEALSIAHGLQFDKKYIESFEIVRYITD